MVGTSNLGSWNSHWYNVISQPFIDDFNRFSSHGRIRSWDFRVMEVACRCAARKGHHVFSWACLRASCYIIYIYTYIHTYKNTKIHVLYICISIYIYAYVYIIHIKNIDIHIYSYMWWWMLLINQLSKQSGASLAPSDGKPSSCSARPNCIRGFDKQNAALSWPGVLRPVDKPYINHI